MNSFFRFSIFASLLFILSSCTTEPPKVRVSNQRSEVIDVQLKRTQANTINLNDIAGNSSTGYIDLSPYIYEVDAKVEGISQSGTTHFTAEEDKSYTIIVSAANPPVVTVVKP
ncbi:MAG: hypothetical protein HY960_01060 [Ignavibacteriae bacterium]|nr:hypothetical protein [Ignavibacteriota bacterium]